MENSHIIIDILMYLSLGSLITIILMYRKKNRVLKDLINKKNIIEKELFEKEHKYSKLVKSIQEGIGILDDNEVFLFANDVAEKILEVPAGKLVGRSVSEFITKDDFEMIKGETEKRKNGEVSRYELNIVTEMGNTRVIEISGSPNYDSNGNYTSSYGVFRDITLEKQAQIKLKESETLFKALLNNAPLPIFYKSINGKYMGCNAEFEKFMGLKESEIVGKTVYDILPGELADIYSSKDEELFSTDGKQIYESQAMGAEDGKRRVINHKVSIKDHLGNITGLIGILVDVTEIRQAEELLIKKQAELEKSNMELETFAYTVSHDLQEPLRMVSSFTGLLKKKYSANLNLEANSYIDFAVGGAERMQDLIKGLLSYSRVSSQASPFEMTDLRDPLDNALKNLALTIEENAVEIEIGDLPEIPADRSQISSVFLNLINNAIKFRKKDQKLKIIISCLQKDNGQYEVAVKDNGIGIEKKHFENIFLVFHRVHSHDKYPGTGIGLSVCKKIIERHGGNIRVESEPDIGTTFYFTLNSGGL